MANNFLTRFSYTDDNGIELGYMMLNVTDMKTYSKLKNIGNDIKEFQVKEDVETEEEVYTEFERFETAVRDIWTNVFGVKNTETMFDLVSPYAVDDEGNLFIYSVIHSLADFYEAEINSKSAMLTSNANKYMKKK